eukprot:scaffold51906_cov75-Phaeocystis_antarctica.AAC.1
MHVNTYLEICRARCFCCLLCSCRSCSGTASNLHCSVLSIMRRASVYHVFIRSSEVLRKLSHPRDLTSYLPYALQSITVVVYRLPAIGRLHDKGYAPALNGAIRVKFYIHHSSTETLVDYHTKKTLIGQPAQTQTATHTLATPGVVVRSRPELAARSGHAL